MTSQIPNDPRAIDAMIAYQTSQMDFVKRQVSALHNLRMKIDEETKAVEEDHVEDYNTLPYDLLITTFSDPVMVLIGLEIELKQATLQTMQQNLDVLTTARRHAASGLVLPTMDAPPRRN